METLKETMSNISIEYEKRMIETINTLSQFYPESIVITVAAAKTPSIIEMLYKSTKSNDKEILQ